MAWDRRKLVGSEGFVEVQFQFAVPAVGQMQPMVLRDTRPPSGFPKHQTAQALVVCQPRHSLITQPIWNPVNWFVEATPHASAASSAVEAEYVPSGLQS